MSLVWTCSVWKVPWDDEMRMILKRRVLWGRPLQPDLLKENAWFGRQISAALCLWQQLHPNRDMLSIQIVFHTHTHTHTHTTHTHTHTHTPCPASLRQQHSLTLTLILMCSWQMWSTVWCLYANCTKVDGLHFLLHDAASKYEVRAFYPWIFYFF